MLLNAYNQGGRDLMEIVAKKFGWKPYSRQRIKQLRDRTGSVGLKASEIYLKKALENEAMILNLYETGKDARYIANALQLRLGCVKIVLRKNASKLKVVNRIRDKKRIPYDVEQKIYELSEQGFNKSQISRKLDLAYTTVLRYLTSL